MTKQVLIKNQYGLFPRFEITKEQLHDLYVNKKMAQREIGRLFNVSSHVVASKLIHFGIGLKNQYDSILYTPPLGAFFHLVHEKTKKKQWQLQFEQHRIFLEHVMDTEIAWLAGIIDGEGYIGIHKLKTYNIKNVSWCPYRYIPEFSITNTNKRLIDKAFLIIGSGKGVKIYKSGPYKANHKVCYHLVVCGGYKLYALLDRVIPFLVAKKEQAQLVLKWAEARRHAGRFKGQNHVGGRAHYSKEDVTLAEHIRLLNKKGVINH